MPKSLFACLALSTALSSSAVFAAEISQSEADRLTRLFETYTGKAPAGEQPYVQVTPDGSSYKLSANLGSVLKSLETIGLKLEVSPFNAMLTPQDDGTWKLNAPQDYVFSYAIGPQVTKYTFEGGTSEWVYDPKIYAFSSGHTVIPKVSIEAKSDKMTVTAVQKDQVADSQARPGAAGTVDQSMKMTSGPLAETLITPPGPVMGDVRIDFSIDGGVSTVDAKGLRNRQLLDTWAYLVAHHTQEDLAARQDELKSVLRPLLPLFDTLSGEGVINGLKVTTPFGHGSLTRGGATFAFDTGSQSGKVAFKYFGSGLAIDSALIPAWSLPLIPESFEVSAAVTGFDLPAVANKALDLLDITAKQPIPNGSEGELLAAVMPKGTMEIALPPSSLKAPTYTLNWQGLVKFDDGHVKTHLDVSATGLDPLTKSLQTVKDKGVAELVIGLYAARALAKPGPDGTLVWAIDIDDAGTFLVNGSPVGPKRK